MPRYQYKLVPAPEKAGKHKGLKGAARFAATLEAVMNELGADGWEYLRADTLPQEERAGLTSKQTVYRNLLVFRRELPDIVEETAAPEAAATPRPAADPEHDTDEVDGALVNLFSPDPGASAPPPDGPDPRR